MSIDIAINLFMTSIQNYSLTEVVKFADFIFEPILLILVAMIISFFLYFSKKKKEGILFFSSMAAVGLITELLKIIFIRMRPINAIISVSGYAFPSGHAVVNLVFFGFIAYIFFRGKSLKTKIISYFLAGILILFVGFTRIYLRVHWLTDVLGGFVVGGVVLAVGIIVLRKIKN